MTTPVSNDRIWTAALVVIGDEILSGRTQDRNIAQLAAWLNVQGIRLAEVRVVADDEGAIVEAVNTLRARNDYLFTTGGIGPTHDDITVDSIAAAFGVGVVHHPAAVAVLERYYATRGGATEARLRMARVPEGADLIENRVSGIPTLLGHARDDLAVAEQTISETEERIGQPFRYAAALADAETDLSRVEVQLAAMQDSGEQPPAVEEARITVEAVRAHRPALGVRADPDRAVVDLAVVERSLAPQREGPQFGL